MHVHVATYDTSSDLEALEFALDVASVTSGSLTVVHVLRPPDDAEYSERDTPTGDSGTAPPGTVDSDVEAPDSGPSDQSGATEDSGSSLQLVSGRDRAAVAASERILADAEQRAAEVGIPVETELLFGDPVEAIVSFATTDGASLIVVERADRSRRSDARGMADEIMRRASMPVVVVPA